MTTPGSLGTRFAPRARQAWVLCALLMCTGCPDEDDGSEDGGGGDVLTDDGGSGAPSDVSAAALDGGAHGNLDAASWADINLDSSAAFGSDRAIPDGSALPSGQFGHPDEIEAVVTEYYNAVGVGGAPIRDVRPVVLLKNGYATRSTNVLITSFDLDADRAKLPGNWFRWRLMDGQIELQNGAQWVRLSSQTRFPPLPPGFRFERSFERLTGSRC